jgi:small basic protein
MNPQISIFLKAIGNIVDISIVLVENFIYNIIFAQKKAIETFMITGYNSIIIVQKQRIFNNILNIRDIVSIP